MRYNQCFFLLLYKFRVKCVCKSWKKNLLSRKIILVNKMNLGVVYYGQGFNIEMVGWDVKNFVFYNYNLFSNI